MQFLVKTLYLKKYLGPHVQYNLCSYVDRQIASLYAYFLHNALFAGIFWRHCKFKNLKTETSTIKSLITSLPFPPSSMLLPIVSFQNTDLIRLLSVHKKNKIGRSKRIKFQQCRSRPIPVGLWPFKINRVGYKEEYF